MTAFGNTSPEAVEMMREALRELYGVQGSLVEQYFAFWRRILIARFRPVAFGISDARWRY